MKFSMKVFIPVYIPVYTVIAIIVNELLNKYVYQHKMTQLLLLSSTLCGVVLGTLGIYLLRKLINTFVQAIQARIGK